VTRTPSYRTRNQKPIRPDRVAIAVLVVVGVILVPILIRSGCTHREDPIVVVDDGTDGVAVGPDETTDGSSTDGASTDGTSEDDTSTPASSRFLMHTVEDGETLGEIATALDVTVAKLLASNRLFSGSQLQPGQVLYASQEGIVHTIQSGQTLSDIARSYAVPLQTLLDENDLTTNSTIFAGDRILVPGVTTSFWANAVTLSKGVVTRFIWPLDGEVVSTFGYRIHPVYEERHHHDGIDIDVPEGTTVHAAASGEVYFYGEQEGYGNVLILSHADGFYTLYGHLADSFVFAGQYVEMGQAVAQSGNTGISSGPHLHFEIRNHEYPVDPERYLP